jgi:hypothetical protein
MNSFAQKYNKGKVNPFTFDLKGYTFTCLKELYNSEDSKNKIYSLDGFYFTRGKFGVHAVVVMSDVKKRVDMPLNLTKVFNDIVNNSEAVDDIKSGKVGFIVRKYESHNKECYSITFKDK